MRILRPAAGLLLCAMLLSGCVPRESIDLPSPEPSSTPVFASEEEALAAAEEAYAAYLRLEDTVAQSGGSDPQRLGSVVTSDWLQKEIEVFDAFKSTGKRQSGDTRVSGFELQQFAETGPEVVAYVCVDSTETRIIDTDGNDVTPKDRPLFTGLEVTFEWHDPDARLLIADSQPWSGGFVC